MKCSFTIKLYGFAANVKNGGLTPASGSTRIDDHTGPERLFVMGGSDVVLSTSENRFTDLKWNAYPVPTRDYLHLDIEASKEDYLVEVFDVNGRMMGQWQNSSSIDVRSLSAGSYWLKITTNDQSAVKKLIKIE